MRYEEARRLARQLLGSNAELRTMKAPAFGFHIGVTLKGVFTTAGAGNSWAEAIADAKVHLQNKSKSGG